MRNIKLTIAYDGSDFHGWQVQPGQPTIQGTLSEKLQQITQESPTLYGAGRTDAGVHAWGQVANFKTESKLLAGDLARALNALLPPAIRIRHAQEVEAEFHARWLALAKTYRYRIYRGRVVPPQLWRYVWADCAGLDFDAMAEGARLFEGEHDFSSFAASTGSEEEDQERTTRRCLFSSEMLRVPRDGETRDGEEWVYVVRGRSFMRNMVRKIMGTLWEVGRGRLLPSDIPRLLALQDRNCSGPTVAAQGLCLHSVEYPKSEVEVAGRDSQQ